MLQALADRVSPRVLHAPGRLDPVARRARRVLRRPPAARSTCRWTGGCRTGFRATVLQPPAPTSATARPRSYAALAALAGNPKAVRAVGTACATNPLPVVVPVPPGGALDGAIGDYAGGAEAKRTLLDLEAGMTLRADRRAHGGRLDAGSRPSWTSSAAG